MSDTAFVELQGAAATVLDPTARMVLWPALGGLVTGIVALGCPEVLYQVRTTIGQPALTCTSFASMQC